MQFTKHDRRSRRQLRYVVREDAYGRAQYGFRHAGT